MHVDDHQPYQHCTDEHHHPDVETGMKCLIAGCGPEQAGGGANGAESEVDFFRPSAGDDEEPQKNSGDDGKDSAEDPRASCHRRCYPNACGGIRRYHLANSNQEKDYGMHQGYDGALPVAEDGKFAHS